MILSYDTETSGFIKEQFPDNDPQQCFLVQLGAILYDLDGTERCSIDMIIHPEGRIIPDETARIHGITTEIAMRCGLPLVVALAAFSNLRNRATIYGGHNIEFDDKIIRIACAQTGKALPKMAGLKSFCTKELATPILNLPPTQKMLAAGRNHPKSPNLGETYKFFFNEELVGAHGAAVDARASARIYFEIMRRT